MGGTDPVGGLPDMALEMLGGALGTGGTEPVGGLLAEAGGAIGGTEPVGGLLGGAGGAMVAGGTEESRTGDGGSTDPAEGREDGRGAVVVTGAERADGIKPVGLVGATTDAVGNGGGGNGADSTLA